MSQTSPSIKKNFAYKSALTLSSYLMSFITFPYISRILGVERVGLVSFVDNTISYFLLFATMGIGILGVREIAAVKNSVEGRSKVFANLLGLNLGFTFLTLLIYLAIVSIVPKFNVHSELFYIGAAKIISTAFLIEWFFTGIEDFRYITLRSLIIRLLYVIAVFVCVRTSDDYKLYFILTTGIVVLNALINSIYVRRFVQIRLREILSVSYLRGNCILGIYSIMTSMYLTFNVMYLGLLTDNVQVGYYTTAFKLYTVILGLFSSFTNVMLPRMSALLAEGEKERFEELIGKSFRAMCTFSLPMIACSIILAPEIVWILSGDGYEGAIAPMRIIMPAAFFVGIAQVLATQVLMPMKKDRILFMASVIGAVTSVVINILTVPHLKSIGTAIVLLGSEMLVTMIYVSYIRHHKIVAIPYYCILKNSLMTIPAIMVCLLCQHYIKMPLIIIAVAGSCSALCWIGYRFIEGHKDKFI